MKIKDFVFCFTLSKIATTALWQRFLRLKIAIITIRAHCLLHLSESQHRIALALENSLALNRSSSQ